MRYRSLSSNSAPLPPPEPAGRRESDARRPAGFATTTHVSKGHVMELLDQPLTQVADTDQLAYGYMRVPCDVPDQKVRRLEQKLRAFATKRGLFFVSFFFEFSCGSHEGFEELLLELQRADAHYVIVPNLRHLARSVLLQNSMIAQLEYDAKAEVLALDD